MQCVMQYMIVHEWNVRTFFWIPFFSSFLVLMNAKCKCHMKMPWWVLPMRYATIVPQYAIDRLLTTDLDVNLLWMQTKHDASLDFLFLVQMLPNKDENVISMMRMSHARMEMQSLFMMMPVHVFKTRCKCLLTEMEMRMSSNGYVMMQMSLCRNAMM